MSSNIRRGSDGRPPLGTGLRAALTNLGLRFPVVCVVAIASGLAVALSPGSAAAVGAVAITVTSIALAGLALSRSEPRHAADRASTASSAVVLPQSSKNALVYLGVAVATACLSPAFHHTASASGSIGELLALVVATCSLTMALTELLGELMAGRVTSTLDGAGIPAIAPTAAPAIELARPSRPLEPLSTEVLCREWKLSFLALRATTDSLARAQIVEDRRRYLNELARRDPSGFERWVTRDPYPVAGHPENFIITSPVPPPVSEN